MRAGLYIHFPFCRAKCSYCHFYSLADRDDLHSEWWEALKREAEFSAGRRLDIDTVYIGGGTPSLLQPDELRAVWELIDACFGLEAAEWTLEVNPEVRDGGVVRGWKDAGVTRLSVGVQSFDDDLIHKANGWLLREAGKADPKRLEKFLLDNGPAIPRTTLRYAIERFPESRRKALLRKTRGRQPRRSGCQSGRPGIDCDIIFPEGIEGP